jgi:hypothetical protein
VRERPNRHAWKACEAQVSVGSNPTSSAKSFTHKSCAFAPRRASGRAAHLSHREGFDTILVSLSESMRNELKPLVFSVMPYGVRLSPETGLRFDFDRIHQEIVVPAARAAGCQVIRSDHEALGGVIHTAMFERLLLADVVVAERCATVERWITRDGGAERSLACNH